MKTLLITLSLLTLFVSTGFPQTTNAVEKTDVISEYQKLSDKVLACIDDDATAVKSIPDTKENRTLKTRLWLEVFNHIDFFHDASVNEGNRPTMNVGLLATEEHSGTPLAGVDPSVINDPVARREYEAAILQNKLNRARHRFQNYLKSKDGQYVFQAVGYLKSAYTDTPDDSKELLDDLDSGLKAEVRKLQIKNMLHEILEHAPKKLPAKP